MHASMSSSNCVTVSIVTFSVFLAQEPDQETSAACQNLIVRLAQRMPEDWAADEKLRKECGSQSEELCPRTPSGLARFNNCMR